MRTGNVHYDSAERRHDEIDLRNLGGALWRNRFRIFIPALFVAVAALFIVGRMTPYYRSEARIIIEVGENVYTRPAGIERVQPELIDEQAVMSQVQLVLSRQVAMAVVEKAGLLQNPDFDPMSQGMSVPKWFMTIFGLIRDPRRMTPEERVLESYYDGLAVYPVMRSRVIGIQFSSSDPQMAAKIANLVAEEYLRSQQSSKQDNTRDASAWLGREIDELRKKVADAEGRVETFRAQTNLFLGANNATLATQQLGELNTQLTEARGALAEAQAKRQVISDLVKGRAAYESLEVANAELIRRLVEQRVMLRSTAAREGRTLLPGHPRMKELTAQLANLDEQIQQEAQVIVRGLENEVKVADSRVDTLQKSIDAQKKVASVANEQDVQLRALEREAKAQRDLLEQFLTRFREASARERPEAAQADARIISRASESNSPYFPKPLPVVMLAFFGTLAFAMALVVAAELMTVREPVYTPVPPRPYSPDDDGYGSGSSGSSRGGHGGSRSPQPAPAASPAGRSSFRAEQGGDPALARLEALAYGRHDEVKAQDSYDAVRQMEETEFHRSAPAVQPDPVKAVRPEATQSASVSQNVAPVIETHFADDAPAQAAVPEKLVGSKSAIAQSKETAMRTFQGVHSSAQSMVKSVQQELRLGGSEDAAPVEASSDLLRERMNRIAEKKITPVVDNTFEPLELSEALELRKLDDNNDVLAPEVEVAVAEVVVEIPEDYRTVAASVAPVVPAFEVIQPEPMKTVSDFEAASASAHVPSLDAESLKAFAKVKAELMDRLAEQSYVSPAADVNTGSAEQPLRAETVHAAPDFEAADVQLVDALATRLAALPRAMEAMSILVVATHNEVDSGHVALKMARALANANRKTVVLDAGASSLDIAAAVKNDAPTGVSDLLSDKVSFAEAIHEDRASAAHVVPMGNTTLSAQKKASGMDVMFGALGFTYDFIVVAGASCEHEDDIRFMAQRCAAAVLVSGDRGNDPHTLAAYDMLQRHGLNDIVVLLSQSPATAAMSRLPASVGTRSA